MTQNDYLNALAAFVCDTQWRDLPEPVRVRGRWILADCIPVIAAGMRVAEMTAFARLRLAQAAPGPAWIVGTSHRASPFEAALINGTAGTWLELDEGNQFAKGHPGIQVVPAALAVAQAMPATGEQLLLAMVLGYEASARISRASKVRLAVHPHGTYGVIGAAIAVARLKGLPRAMVREIINVAATMGMATSRRSLLEGATVRNIYTGHAGLMGQLAVQLVECGFTGERDAVGSIYGAVLSDDIDRPRVVSGLGSDWLITQGYFKLHCTGRYVHSAIDALEAALASWDGPVDAEAIERIDVRAYKLAAMLSGQDVTTSFGARFSVPFALATILHHGHSDLAAFEDDAVRNPAVQQLVRRVHVVEDTAHTQVYPDLQRCDIEIRWRSGKVSRGHCELTRGEPGNPHSSSELEGKFLGLARHAWSEPRAQALLQGLMSLDAVDDVAAFLQPFEHAE